MRLPKIDLKSALVKERLIGRKDVEPSSSPRGSPTREPDLLFPDEEDPYERERKRSVKGVVEAKDIVNPYLQGAEDPIAFMHETGSVSAKAAPHLRTLRARSFRASVTTLLPTRLPSLNKGTEKFADYMESWRLQNAESPDEDGGNFRSRDQQQLIRLARRDSSQQNSLDKEAWMAARNVLATSRLTQKDENGRSFFIDRYTGKKVFMFQPSAPQPLNPSIPSPLFQIPHPPVKYSSKGKHRDGFITSRARRVQKIREQLLAEKLELEDKLAAMQKTLFDIHHGKPIVHQWAEEAAAAESEVISVEVSAQLEDYKKEVVELDEKLQCANELAKELSVAAAVSARKPKH